jgi:hypothetical protein
VDGCGLRRPADRLRHSDREEAWWVRRPE